MRHYKAYDDTNILEGAKQVKSLTALLKILGLKPAGGNFYTIKKKLKQLNINCDHWTGQAWNKNEMLKDWESYTKSNRLKIHLIKERGIKCEKCNNTNWLNNPIPLELHHKDGNRTNNEYSNLELNCPNCHSFTPFYRNRKKLKTKEERFACLYDVCLCGETKRKKSKNCKKCQLNHI